MLRLLTRATGRTTALLACTPAPAGSHAVAALATSPLASFSSQSRPCGPSPHRDRGGSSSSSRPHPPSHRAAAAAVAATTKTRVGHLSADRFADLALSARSKHAILHDFQYELLTHVQSETFAAIRDGKDVLARAKTGNGKTVAFLLPLVEKIVEQHARSHSKPAVPALVVSPTRELAQQIAAEAARLVAPHGLHVGCFVGGTSLARDARVLASDQPPLDLLIATPGRLLDHLAQDTGHLRLKLRRVHTLVLDEADRLLDMGFRHDITKLLTFLPSNARQTLLFSATVPTAAASLSKGKASGPKAVALHHEALREDYVYIDTIGDDEEHTNSQAVQEVVRCAMHDVFPTVERVLAQHRATHGETFKVIVFCATARMAQFMAQAFAATPSLRGHVLEMHSRKSQSVRTKTADAFRRRQQVVMFSSDVSARGVDYPDVTLVLQVGWTERDQYIHRLGRTARAGGEGRGVLVAAEFEARALQDELKDLPVTEISMPESSEDTASGCVSEVAQVLSAAAVSKDPELARAADKSYQAWLGFYNTHARRLGMSKEALVRTAQAYSDSIGLSDAPRLEAKILKKMNLLGVAGLEPAPVQERASRGRSHSRSHDSNSHGHSHSHSHSRDHTDDPSRSRDRDRSSSRRTARPSGRAETTGSVRTEQAPRHRGQRGASQPRTPPGRGAPRGGRSRHQR